MPPFAESTPAGLQYVLPGAECRTAPCSAYCMDEHGQLLLPGYTPPTEAERRARPSGRVRRLRPGKLADRDSGILVTLF